MDVLVNQLCKAYFDNHPDIIGFGPAAAYVAFDRIMENRNIPVSAWNLRHTFVQGRIEYRVAGGQGQLSGKLLVKCFDSLQQAAGAADGFASFGREMVFFRQLMPALRRVKRVSCVPKVCASRVFGTDTANQKVILFECPTGIVNFACCSFLGESHLSLMVRHIADLHVAYWLARSADPTFWPEEKHVRLPYAQPAPILPLLKRCFQPIDEVAQNAVAHLEAKERLRRMLDDFDEHLRAPFEPSSRNACWTMCHQSYGQNNVIFEYHRHIPTHMRIFNWQSMGFASLGVDLVIVLFVEQRRRRGQMIPQLVQEYWEALHEIPVAERPTLEAINAEIKRCIPLALYVLACRVQKASSKTQPDSSLFPIGCWNEILIIKLFRYLITSDFV